jgi:hypothetical protein
VRTAVERGEAPGFLGVTSKNTVELAREEQPFAWSYVDFVRKRHPEQLGPLCRAVKARKPLKDALQETLGVSPFEFETRWESFVRAEYALKKRRRRDLAVLLRGPRRALIGVVHLAATPGAPLFAGSTAEVLERARVRCPCPRARRCGRAARREPRRRAVSSPSACRPRPWRRWRWHSRPYRELAEDRPVGVNVLRNDARAALGLCAATGASVPARQRPHGAMVTDQGCSRGAPRRRCASARACARRPASWPTCT